MSSGGRSATHLRLYNGMPRRGSASSETPVQKRGSIRNEAWSSRRRRRNRKKRCVSPSRAQLMAQLSTTTHEKSLRERYCGFTLPVSILSRSKGLFLVRPGGARTRMHLRAVGAASPARCKRVCGPHRCAFPLLFLCTPRARSPLTVHDMPTACARMYVLTVMLCVCTGHTAEL